MGICSLSLPDFQKPIPMPTMTKNFLAGSVSKMRIYDLCSSSRIIYGGIC
jgi:hypothetical protein